MKTKIFSLFLLISIIFVGLASSTPAKASPTDTVLYNFTGVSPDGQAPMCISAISGSTIYGVAMTGGVNGHGFIYSESTSGGSPNILHNFSANGIDCLTPRGCLVLSGNVLYGSCMQGGTFSSGDTFKMNIDGSGFTILENFPGAEYSPQNSPVVVGNTLYGTFNGGGANNKGGIYSVGTDGSNYQTIYSLGTISNDGSGPQSTLTLSADGNTFYGTTSLGGINSKGIIFSINKDGSNYQKLYDFGATNDGANPSYSSLAISGNTLYGMTRTGGINGLGTIFKINTNGTGYSKLYDFGGVGDGSTPFGSLIISGSTLYGMTNAGGAYGYGAIFSINTDGTNYTQLYSFAGAPTDGASSANLMTYFALSNNTLYGTTQNGGASNKGTIFSFPLTPPNSAPSLTAGPSGPSSSVTVGGTASFNATATTTPSTDNYYLAICKNNSITPNPSSPPTCGGLGAWCVSPSTASGSQANCSYTTQQSDIATDPNPWYAFVCDNNSNPLCSSVSQGTGSTASPFTVTIPVSSITVTATGGATSLLMGSTLQMLATVSPSNANNPTVAWSAVNGTGSATIDPSTGILTSVTQGTVTVIATSTDGSNITGTEQITVTVPTPAPTITYGGGGGGAMILLQMMQAQESHTAVPIVTPTQISNALLISQIKQQLISLITQLIKLLASQASQTGK